MEIKVVGKENDDGKSDNGIEDDESDDDLDVNQSYIEDQKIS